MKAFVGTSGWSYDWNESGTLSWYVTNTGLNAIELNGTFYGFPKPGGIKSWARDGENLAWSVKVNRSITHTRRFNPEAFKAWNRFHRLFRSFDHLVHFYLFQLHPAMRWDSSERVGDFARRTGLRKRFALEPRHHSWFNGDIAEWAQKLDITLVSVDAPDLPREVFNTAGLVYIRMHGRTGWYNHNYTRTELRGVAREIRKAKARSAYVFFNNNHNMPGNAKDMIGLLAKDEGNKPRTVF